jgi:uncharacterized membrane protein YdbT with pleckstrin-like domain
VAYPEKLLGDDEKIVEHLHPHWITLVPATLWFIVICAAGGFGLGEIHSHMHGTARTVVVIVVIVVALGVLSYTTFRPWIGWRTTHYVFTRRGVFTHTGRDISLQRINDVGFTQSLWDRLVGAGSMTIESAGEHSQEELDNIPHSDEMQQKLNRLIEQDGDRRARMAYGGQGAPPVPPQQGGEGGQYPPTQQ